MWCERVGFGRGWDVVGYKRVRHERLGYEMVEYVRAGVWDGRMQEGMAGEVRVLDGRVRESRAGGGRAWEDHLLQETCYCRRTEARASYCAHVAHLLHLRTFTWAPSTLL